MNLNRLKILPLIALLPWTTAYAALMTPQQAVVSLHLEELANTYKTTTENQQPQQQNHLKANTLLMDMGVINADDLKHPQRLSHKLTQFVNDNLDTSENYLGNVHDENIVERINHAWKYTKVIDDPKVLAQLNQFIDKGYTTGYNVIDTDDLSHFHTLRTIRYGHNNIRHADQLIYLMRIKGFDPKVQLSVKSSAFLYLAKWGKPTYPVTTLPSGKMVAVAKEYNLDFEFKSVQRKAQFMALINQYAKKDSKNEKGLIYEAWWQPFYRSYTPMKGYDVLMENRIEIGNYQAQLMVLPEKAQAQAEHIQRDAPKMQVHTLKTWVNPSFYRYMHGDYK
ncbi:hypothetical protein [Celerinatantimonas sp. MCCC 1A17872]|uniref:hypothetical protein n=1 Tax=Celerinatantimonas sp. MCCC 1A17872 TaxID=3177514 RepID=UPI0038CA77D0